MLIDPHQRVHNYLRISLTDNCNLRCLYCMPHEDMQFMTRAHLMQPGEIISIAEAFVELGVTKIRLTGGEPLVRKEFPEIVQHLSQLPVQLTLTTNGIFLHKHVDALLAAGVHTINVSLDSLDPETFRKLTRRDAFQQVWDNIMLLHRKGFRVKINAVAMDGIVQREIADFVELTRTLPLHVRFIEFMPFSGNHWHSNKVVTANEMLEWVRNGYDIVKLKDEPHATAKKYQVVGFNGTLAFITTMSEHFCGDCNRLRLTADGKMKNCLFGKEELDLLDALRTGRPIVPIIRQSVAQKHAVMGGQFARGYQKTGAEHLENRSMIRIGG